MRGEIKELRKQLADIKEEEKAIARKARESAEREAVESLNLAPEWMKLLEVGMTAREITTLHELTKRPKLKTLGEILGVTPGRAAQIRNKSLRKLRHPKRIGLVDALGPVIYRGVYGEDPANGGAVATEGTQEGANL